MKRLGFALNELVALVVVAATVASIFLIMSDRSRRTGRLGDDLSKLREIGALNRSYAADNADRVCTFSWRVGNYTTQWPDLQNASTNLDAAAKQAVAIMRERSGNPALSRVNGWLPHINFSHLPLLDYAGDSLPQTGFISSGDRSRLQWAADPDCFMSECFPCQPPPTGSNYRWVYSSSFAISTAFIDLSPAGNRMWPGPQHGTVFVPGNVELGAALMTDVAHPSQNVMVGDSFARHFGVRQPGFFLAEARIPVLFADGAAALRSSGDSNLGANPNQWHSATPPEITYMQYACWEPPTVSGKTDVGVGRYRWTRMGLKGRDFGGPEVWP